MASLTENQKKLMDKLAEMFQFDQADLDFGIYRIMNYKRNEIKRFLEQDLMPQISAQLTELSQSSNSAELAKIEKDIQNAQAMDLDEDIKAGMIEKLKEKKRGLHRQSRYYRSGSRHLFSFNRILLPIL